MAEIMKKIIRTKDNRVFYIKTIQDGSEFLCSESGRVLKTLDSVKDINERFRSFISGYDDLKETMPDSRIYDGYDNYKVW